MRHNLFLRKLYRHFVGLHSFLVMLFCISLLKFLPIIPFESFTVPSTFHYKRRGERSWALDRKVSFCQRHTHTSAANYMVTAKGYINTIYLYTDVKRSFIFNNMNQWDFPLYTIVCKLLFIEICFGTIYLFCTTCTIENRTFTNARRFWGRKIRTNNQLPRPRRKQTVDWYIYVPLCRFF